MLQMFYLQEGFNFHHSRDNFVMMYKWLPTNSSSNLPPACHTNLGVGGIVLNEKNQILVVSEKDIEYPHWKLPGGYVERGNLSFGNNITTRNYVIYILVS